MILNYSSDFHNCLAQSSDLTVQGVKKGVAKKPLIIGNRVDPQFVSVCNTTEQAKSFEMS